MKFDEIWWKYVIFDEYTGAIFASSKLRACNVLRARKFGWAKSHRVDSMKNDKIW